MNTTVRELSTDAKLLKADDVADRLEISRSKAYQLMKRGKIPTVRFDASVRVRPSDLEEYIQRCWSGWE